MRFKQDDQIVCVDNDGGTAEEKLKVGRPYTVLRTTAGGFVELLAVPGEWWSDDRFVHADKFYTAPGVKVTWSNRTTDPIHSPSHYTHLGAKCSSCREPIEPWDLSRHLSFNLGNVVKYAVRAGHKGDAAEDLRKAVAYLEDEIERLAP